MLMNMENKEGSDSGTTLPFNKVISPPYGAKKSGVQKFMMMYTCNMCNHRNAHMIAKIAYEKGMVITTCASCRQRHLIADNQERMDMPEMPRRVEHLLQNLGQKVQKMHITEDDLERYLIVEKDGELALYPKAVGPPPTDLTIVDLPKKPPRK
eukprot:gene12301-13455_t